MANPNLIKVTWDFGMAQGDDAMRMLNLRLEEIEDMSHDELYEKALATSGVPEYVDLDLFFEDPREISEYQITDALSDEYGWCVLNYVWVSDTSF